MIKSSKPGKQSVELKPSRIRRDPVAIGKAAEPTTVTSYWHTTEGEAWIVGIGVVLFALAVAVITIGFSNFTAS